MASPIEEGRGDDGRGEVTRLLGALSEGDAEATERVAERVHAELRRLAAACLRGERADHTLQPTALVNEAWMRLVGQDEVSWQNRAHFLGVAALAMRRVLVEHARRRQRDKRGGGARREPLRTDFPDAAGLERGRELDLLALDAGLEQLERHSARAARVIELRFFAGLTEQESATVLGVTRATVARDWRAARAWLARELRKGR
jgi:RNA polymerase sigma factor (TIGR02999 family)